MQDAWQGSEQRVEGSRIAAKEATEDTGRGACGLSEVVNEGEPAGEGLVEGEVALGREVRRTAKDVRVALRKEDEVTAGKRK